MPAVYHYDENSGEFTGAGTAAVDPEATRATGEVVYLIPARATTVRPPALHGHTAFMIDGKWTMIEDHRGKTVYSEACRRGRTVSAPGPLKEGETELPPPSEYHSFNGKIWEINRAGRAALIEAVRARIDAGTDEKILTGFRFRDRSFKLSIENQINFKGECDIRHTLSYPVPVKCDGGYFMIESPACYFEFYRAIARFIRETLSEGWSRKDAVSSLSDDQLMEAANVNRV